MNIYVLEELKQKYPQIEWRGKPKTLVDRTVIEAYNPATNMSFWYSFEEDFFWLRNTELPNWKMRKE